MNRKAGILIALIYLGSVPFSRAQEVLVPSGQADMVPTGPGTGQYGRSASTQSTMKSAEIDDIPDTLELPFFDDFSSRNWLPDPVNWTDEYVFVNNSYTRNPVTLGVATLDAINSDGTLNGTVSTVFESDFLTSAPINLEYPGRQDIWLSFFYQPKGLGDAPETEDSLMVEFLSPGDSTVWETVWSVPGSANDTFRQVFINIREDRFLQKGFRFRFKNFASMPNDPLMKDFWSNVDHWNLDYVHLDTARKSNVSALNDISMISSLESVLKTYQSLPWRHFGAARNTELKPFLDISYRNNDTTTRNAARILKITDLNHNFSDSLYGGAANAEPGVLHTFSFANEYPWFGYDADSALFEIKSYLITEELDIKSNDTVVRYQEFFNYYAYDDGSAESGYGLNGEGTANASVACRFKTFNDDTLRGVNLYFNRTHENYSQDYFRLAVWDHDESINRPGNLIYSMAGVKPEYGSELNQFYTYKLDTTIVVSDLFYVGWIKTTERILNVGWDMLKDNRNNIFFNLGQEWVNTKFSGSLMIRPVMGAELVWPAPVNDIPRLQPTIYPNPANDRFFLDLPSGPGDFSVDVFNLQGRMVYSSGRRPVSGTDAHYIGDLPEGLYIVRVNRAGGYSAGSKLMIIR